VGFFGDLNKLRQIGAEQSASFDVKASLGTMQARMDETNAAMKATQPTELDPASEARRVDAVATVSSARQTGMVLNFVNNGVELALLVMLPPGIPLPVTTTIFVPQLNLSRLQPGAQLHVTIDPTIPASVRIDWSR
jgi:hypothetical protein